MKNFVLLLLLCACGIAKADTDRPRRDIMISDLTIPAQPDILRSPVPVAEAWIDYDMGCIEVDVNATLGHVEVVIADMTGIPVAKASIDTNGVPYTLLQLPGEGMYTLTISGGDYLGKGNFTIER